MIVRQFCTAEERYINLLPQHPHLLHRVALGHVASYSGITQVTVNRVRAKLRQANQSCCALTFSLSTEPASVRAASR
ncbi:hypothetical protein HER32_11130 [Hymenobacter sp. BT18]|uniref:hypothetical protein n=1 Tax=Hymenobacter sp. BT18 TaxID=2835648 RepID=UPI00143E23F1|nr:hypothetical protein [Hymenobacter sp. BT18]QIX61702.1 hypothetical protein HER32_11130 [Hymenobacter sp. BT18]